MTPKPFWLGHFFGGALGLQHYEVLTIQHIPIKERKDEAALMRTKWFDYRRLHPMQATYFFVKCYNEAYRHFCHVAINAEKAPYARGIKGHDFLEAREKLAFWRLRRTCDQFGLPYDFFLRFAMNWLHKMVAQDGNVYAPRPAMLGKNEELLADALIAWEELCAASMQVASDPYYRVANFTGSDDQRDHEAFVIGQIARRRAKHYSLHAALYIFDAVRLEEALRQFDQSTVLQAINEVVLPDHVSQQ